MNENTTFGQKADKTSKRQPYYRSAPGPCAFHSEPRCHTKVTRTSGHPSLHRGDKKNTSTIMNLLKRSRGRPYTSFVHITKVVNKTLIMKSYTLRQQKYHERVGPYYEIIEKKATMTATLWVHSQVFSTTASKTRTDANRRCSYSLKTTGPITSRHLTQTSRATPATSLTFQHRHSDCSKIN